MFPGATTTSALDDGPVPRRTVQALLNTLEELPRSFVLAELGGPPAQIRQAIERGNHEVIRRVINDLQTLDPGETPEELRRMIDRIERQNPSASDPDPLPDIDIPTSFPTAPGGEPEETPGTGFARGPGGDSGSPTEPTGDTLNTTFQLVPQGGGSSGIGVMELALLAAAVFFFTR
jgi:hypothetical protein